MNEKALWNELATRNYKYYVYSDKGKRVTDVEFDESGEIDYKRLILDDVLIKDRFPRKNEVSILEIGCGAGRLIKPMSNDFKTVIGTDISNVMLHNARQRLGNRDNVTLTVTDGQTIPCPDNSIDLIFSYIVFQHIKDIKTIENNFKEAHRVLKSGGIFKVLSSYVKYKSMYFWWSGVCFSDSMISDYKLIKKELTPDNRVWLWLEK